jgi:hypothetical protein
MTRPTRGWRHAVPLFGGLLVLVGTAVLGPAGTAQAAAPSAFGWFGSGFGGAPNSPEINSQFGANSGVAVTFDGEAQTLVLPVSGLNLGGGGARACVLTGSIGGGGRLGGVPGSDCSNAVAGSIGDGTITFDVSGLSRGGRLGVVIFPTGTANFSVQSPGEGAITPKPRPTSPPTTKPAPKPTTPKPGPGPSTTAAPVTSAPTTTESTTTTAVVPATTLPTSTTAPPAGDLVAVDAAKAENAIVAVSQASGGAGAGLAVVGALLVAGGGGGIFLRTRGRLAKASLDNLSSTPSTP